MQTKIIRLHAPRRKSSRDDPQGLELDRITLRALAELVVDVMEERGAIPPRPTWEIGNE